MPWIYISKFGFILGSELWEEHFESFLALVCNIIEIWEERKGYVVIIHVLTNPVISLQPGILRILRGGSLAQVCLCGSAHTIECVIDGLGTYSGVLSIIIHYNTVHVIK